MQWLSCGYPHNTSLLLIECRNPVVPSLMGGTFAAPIPQPRANRTLPGARAPHSPARWSQLSLGSAGSWPSTGVLGLGVLRGRVDCCHEAAAGEEVGQVGVHARGDLCDSRGRRWHAPGSEYHVGLRDWSSWRPRSAQAGSSLRGMNTRSHSGGCVWTCLTSRTAGSATST